MNGSWRVALRLARRDLADHRLRTALTATLVGLPVFFAAAMTALLLGTGNAPFAIAIYVPLSLLIVLLAIPAFGVTARTRLDQLALIESTGGTPADLRRVIAAGGLLTGLLGVVSALALALLVWLALVVLVQVVAPTQNSPVPAAVLALWPLLAAFAVAASVVAALITAHTVPDTDLRGQKAPSRIVLLTGCALVLVGLLLTFSVRGDGLAIAPVSTVLGVGVVLLVPSIVSVVARLATGLPLAVRLSARDADRHRTRTAPAIAAVMAGVAAVTALGIGSASDRSEQLAEGNLYELPIGAFSVEGEPQAIEKAASSSPGGLNVVPLDTPDFAEGYLSLPYVNGGDLHMSAVREYVVADADTAAAWGVDLSAQQRAALGEGKALVGPDVQVDNGQLRTTVQRDETVRGDDVSIPALEADLSLGEVPAGARPRLASVVIPPQVAQELDLSVAAFEGVIDRRDPTPSAAQLDALREVPGISVNLQESSVHESNTIVFWLLTLLGTGIVGLATGTAVALARIDSRDDATTLVSMGATPSTARWTAATSALLIGGLGSVLGVAVGFVPGARAARALTDDYGDQFLTIPWALLGTVGVGFPLVIAAIACATAGRSVTGPSQSLR